MSRSLNPRLAAAIPLLAMFILTGCGLLPIGGSRALQVPFDETFEEESENWDVYDDGIVSYEFADGQMVVTINDVNASAWSTLNAALDDFSLQVDTIKLGGPDDNGFGVLFRYQDPDNFYRFDISSDGFYSATKAVDGTFEEVSPWKFSDEINVGEQGNRLQVIAQGNAFQFAVNDTLLNLCIGEGALWDPQDPDTCLGGQVTQTWIDDTFSSGRIALGVTSFMEPGPSIGFDNLVVREPDAAS